MNFIDKYRKELEKDGADIMEQFDDEMTPEEAEELNKVLSAAVTQLSFEETNEYLKKMAPVFCDIADIFMTRFRGKLTNTKIVELIVAFYGVVKGLLA